MSQTALQLGFICRAAQLLKEWCSFPRISIKQNLTQFEERYKVTFSHLSSLLKCTFTLWTSIYLLKKILYSVHYSLSHPLAIFFPSTNNTHLLRILGWLLPPLNYKAGNQAKKKKSPINPTALNPWLSKAKRVAARGKFLWSQWRFEAGSSLLCSHFFSCGKQGLLSSCGAQASCCHGFSYCEARGAQAQ